MNFHPNDVVRRARVAAMILLGIFVFLCAGFFRTQIVQNKNYALTSEHNRLRLIPLPAARGQILDRHGAVLAETVPGYLVALRAESDDSLRATLARLRAMVPLTDAEITAVINRYKRDPTRPTVVIPDASGAVIAVLEEHKTDFPGLTIQPVPKRHYPNGTAVASLVGYISEINDSLLRVPKYADRYKAGQEIGRSGLEQQYEEALRGQEGTKFVEVDAHQNIVREVGARQTIDPIAGAALQTNIDLDLQTFIADSIFKSDTLVGGMIALDPRNGDVLALYSAPTFDPNEFIGGISSEQYTKLQNDPGKPFYNKVIQGTYAPASTFKLATAVMALQYGIVGLDQTMPRPCTGSYQFGSRNYLCWKRDGIGHGNITLARAIEVSCDVYFYQLGIQLTMRRILSGAESLGFQDSTGIDLPNETRPRLPPTEEYVRKAYPGGGASGEVLNLSIGQGMNQQTVASMARFYSALAMGGEAYAPHIVKQPPSHEKLFDLPADQMAGLRKALAGVVAEGGTAASAQIQGIVLAGKTGTGQATGQVHDNAWFVGFAPADDPQIVVAVVFVRGDHGYVAAQAAKRAIERYLKRSTSLGNPTEG